MIEHNPLKPAEALVHGCCLEIGGRGVLLLGSPGSGKSDLLLRLIDQPGSGITGMPKTAKLVADDQVSIRLREGKLIASSPQTIAGRLEIRGLGIVAVPYADAVELSLAVRLSSRQTIERLPEMEKSTFDILDKSLPMIMVDAVSASAPARIRAALDWLAASA